MSNDVRVTVTGNVGSDPVIRRSAGGREWVTFPVASTRRIRDAQGEFYDGPTVWFQVKAWGHAAVNISRSVTKGQPVMVAGRLDVDVWGEESRPRTTLVISADCVGPNLMKGWAEFRRVIPSHEPPGAVDRVRGGAGASGAVPGDVPGEVPADPWAELGGPGDGPGRAGGPGRPDGAGGYGDPPVAAPGDDSRPEATGAGRAAGETA